jgi:hypothetical protein
MVGFTRIEVTKDKFRLAVAAPGMLVSWHLKLPREYSLKSEAVNDPAISSSLVHLASFILALGMMDRSCDGGLQTGRSAAAPGG